MNDELLDVIDIHNNVVKQEMKSLVHKQGLPHRVSAVLLKNSRGEYLIPTASSIKVEAGGLYHSAAGHIPSGETYAQGAVREVWEETGLKITEEQLNYLGTFWQEKEYTTRKEKERFQVYSVNYCEELGEIKLNDEQIDGKWLSSEELMDIFIKTPEKLSSGLFLTCKNILSK